MNDLRTAAQQALEAMLNFPDDISDEMFESITALKAALAEPVQEPVAWIHTDPDKRRVKFLEWRENEPGYRGDWIKTPLYAAPPQRPAEPVQEPVAWLVTDCIGERDLCFSPPLDNDQVLPLYAAPPQRPAEPVQEPVAWTHINGTSDTKRHQPQRKPLTEEEIYSLFRTVASPVMFARAVERAHGIT